MARPLVGPAKDRQLVVRLDSELRARLERVRVALPKRAGGVDLVTSHLVIVESVQRIMLAASRSEPVREAKEVRLVDLVEDLYGGTLDNLVFQRRHAKRPHPTVRLRNEDSANRLRSVRSALQAFGE